MKKILLVMLLLTFSILNTCAVPSNAEFQTMGDSAHEVSLEIYSITTVDTIKSGSATTETPPQVTEITTPQMPGNVAPQTIENTDQAFKALTPEDVTITLSFAGDCTIGDDEKYTWNTFHEVYEKVKNPAYFFERVKSVLAYDDFTFINFEGTFTTATEKAVKEYRFKGDPAYIEVLLEGSIEGVTLANNHSLDYLEKGFDDTVQTLNDGKIAYTYFDTYFIKEIKGLKIGFLGYKGWENEKRSNALLEKHIKEMRELGVDFIVANYHWGDQNSYTPNALQKRMAHFAIDNGVDLVIGHHPHVLQGMEIYKGKNIVYSLGNFCFGGAPNPTDKDTIIYQQIITFDSVRQNIMNSGHRIIPVSVSSEAERNNYQPTVVYGEEEKRIREKYNKISQGL